MTNGYNPKSFWNERFGKYGHTGEADALLYAYDQPQRLRAIDKALSRAKVPINADTKILDIGCGTGDLIGSLVKYGEPEITGIDISDETISYVRTRFASNRKVNFFVIGVEDMDFPSHSFDLAVGINVLQHITGEQTFFRAVENVVRVVKIGGHILAMDFSPARVENRRPTPCIIIRSRQEYIDAFENRGCKFVSEFGLPRIGVRLYRTVYRNIARVAKGLLHSQTGVAKTRDVEETSPEGEQSQSLKHRMNYLVEVVLLKLALPFDYLLVPFPSRYTDMRILIFEKLPEQSR